MIEEITVGLALVGSILNANKRVEGFYFWLCANGLGIYLFIGSKLYYIAGLYFVYSIIALYGIWRWGK